MFRVRRPIDVKVSKCCVTLARLTRRLSRPAGSNPGLGPAEAGPLLIDPSGSLAAYGQLLRQYRPRRYRGAVSVFWALEEPAEPGCDPWRLWPAVARVAEIVSIPGGHLTCLTIHGRELAAAMRARLGPAPAPAEPPDP